MTDSRTEGRGPLVIAGRYEVQVEIGAGAFATTWRGMDQRLGRLVAIKILHAHVAQDPAYVQRFEREAQAAASVSHGNVVDIYDVGRQDDLLYIVMQYVAGEDLKRLIVREHVLAPDRAREIVLQILAGLGAIHAAGIVHRDIKPQNVLVGSDGQVRVADFGIAHLDDQGQLTTAGTAFGTAAYMAPEQADGRDIGPATDLYAVGVVLYELLTGTLPFSAPTSMAMILAHRTEVPQPPSARATRWPVSAALDAVVMQALQKRPEDRFRSAAAMARALQNASIHGARPAGPAHGNPAKTSTSTRPIAQPEMQRRQGHPNGGRAMPPPAESGTASAAGRGLSGVVNGFLVLLLIAAAAGAFYLWQATRGDDLGSPPASPTPTVVLAAPTQPAIAPPIEQPTPTETPQEIAPEPTATDIAMPTEEAPTIEPIGPDSGTQGTGADAGAQPGSVIEPAPTPTPIT